uniref:MRG domain-containing protein n=1 Tax=Rhabditophanes sp. KR3021 TaxID=114890 RepID=A0AC35U7N2_9BILA
MGLKMKDISIRRIKPTLPDIPVKELVDIIKHWNTAWEFDASIRIYDEGIAQYLLTDMLSHLKFYAALCLDKPSLKCSLVPEEEAPIDLLEENYENHLSIVYNSINDNYEKQLIEKLKHTMSKRGFRFTETEPQS